MEDSVNQLEKPNQLSARVQDEEIEIAQLFVVLWGYRMWIVGCTSAIAVMGVVYALLATPIYYSEATIAPKETGKGGSGASGILSQLGGMSGMVASQLGLGNANLDKLEIILKSHELAETVIEKNDLLPMLYPTLWDAKQNAWKSKNVEKVPTVRMGIKKLKSQVLKVNLEAKKNIIRVGASLTDPQSAKRLIDFYLEALNDKIRADVMRDADANREYLERQLGKTGDPMLSEKIQNMIAFEIEKYMLVSHQAFEVLERPVVPMERAKPRRKMIVMISVLVGILLSVVGVFASRGIRSMKMLVRT